MADARISQLPAATTVASQDFIPFTSVTANETRKITANNLAIVLTQLGLTVGTSAPVTPYNGQLWVDTNTNPPILKVYNGATFIVVSTDTASDARYLQITTAASTYLALAGGTLTGDLTLSGNPTTTNMASNKGYVDAQVSASLPLSGGTLTGNLTLTGDPTAVNMASNKGYVDAQVAAVPALQASVPTGAIIHTAGSSAPTGYLKANGDAVSRSTYSVLFAVIGTTYGAGNGSTTFNVPDLRGEFVRGWIDDRNLVKTIGDQNFTLEQNRLIGSNEADGFESHKHGVFQGPSIVGPGAINSSGVSTAVGLAGNNTRTTEPVDFQGNNSFTNIPETRPRNVALLACIKT